MIVFTCHVCRTSLSADGAHAGQLMRCPTCLTALRVPVPEGALESIPTAAISTGASPDASAPLGGTRFPGKRYGFNCGYCSSRLEATEAMAAQEGQCPTCGNQITIPIIDRYGRLIDPKTREIIKQDPHPVHAYAAAGERAPRINRATDGRQSIICPRCSSASPITANNCKSCSMPFTMEGTTLEASSGNNGFCVAALVLGIVSIPAGCTIVTPILAVLFGVIGLNQVNKANGAGGSGRGLAIAGIICGALGGLLAMKYYGLL